MNTTNKPGYKQTKLGWIPEEWEVVKLGDISLINGDYGINAAAVDFDEELPIYLRITDINEKGRLNKEKLKCVNNSNYKDFILKDKDIVFARTGATVGKTYIHDEIENGELIFAGFLIRFRINSDISKSEYIKYCTETSNYWGWVNVMSVRSGQPGINSKEYCSMILPLPSLKEQQKIAEILSKWDTAIQKMKTLIQKKQELKKGLMQQLLTGKVRFEGFDGKWKEMRLGELGSPLMCKRIFKKQTTTNSTNSVPFYKIGTFGKEADAYISFELYKEYKEKYSFPKVGDILISASGTIGRLVVYDGADAYFQDSNIVWLDHDGELVFNTYLYYCYLTFNWQTSDGGIIKRLYNSNLKSMRVFFPTEKKEQQKIAQVLSLADEEISTLEKELLAMEEQKKGLMQVLLTGVVRV